MTDNLKLDPKQLYFLPLGGSEEFGANLNLYCHEGSWLAIDLGMGFADQRFPGIDILLPDPTFLEERKNSLEALIITHAHEDHIGAVPHLWPRLRCPVYCSEFTAAFLRKKISEFPECRDMDIRILNPGENVQLGPFNARFIHVSHSVPGTCALVLETSVGRVLHSGDWNLDPAPVVGAPTDEKAFQDLGHEGVLAYIGDSTNAPVPGRSGSESTVEKGLEKVFRECNGRVAITMFASNVGRIQSICKAAEACGRSVSVTGRSLHRMVGVAKSCGFLEDVNFLNERDISSLPNEKQVMIVTGSQGEARAALARIARGDHKDISLGKGDTVVFSARPIPGNEKEIDHVKNNLVAAGVKIVGANDTKHTIHVSGHPYRDEIADMYQWLKPEIVVPVHGERFQIEAQAELARKCQIQNVIVPMNGSVISLGPGAPETITHVETGILAVEPNRLLDGDHIALSERRKLQYSGVVQVSVVIDSRGYAVTEPVITSLGLIDPNDPDEELEDDLFDEVQDVLAGLDKSERHNDDYIHEEVRLVIRRFIRKTLRLKPVITVHLIRV